VTQNVADADIAKGGYILSDAADARAVLIATGSEIKLALDAQAALAAEGIAVRVVSMPCTNVFDRQDKAYRSAVLGAHIRASPSKPPIRLLAQVRRPARCRDRHRPLWRIRPGRPTVRPVRFHCRQRRVLTKALLS
jgi:hypothetical protein